MSKPIHIKKFDGGRSTPAEMHRKMVFSGHPCSTCGDAAAIKLKILADDAEYRRREPDHYLQLITKFEGDPAFLTKYGRMVVIEEMYACDRCKDSLRKYAANHVKDYMIAEFDEGGLDSTYPTKVGGS